MFGVPETSIFTEPPGSYEFCGSSFGNLKNQERASKFGWILGRDRGLVNNCSATAGRAPNWTGRALNIDMLDCILEGTREPHQPFFCRSHAGNVNREEDSIRQDSGLLQCPVSPNTSSKGEHVIQTGGVLHTYWRCKSYKLVVHRRMSNAALANAASVLSSKNWKNIQNGWQRRKKISIQKALGQHFQSVAVWE